VLVHCGLKTQAREKEREREREGECVCIEHCALCKTPISPSKSAYEGRVVGSGLNVQITENLTCTLLPLLPLLTLLHPKLEELSFNSRPLYIVF
jgi:hypothetical protein